MSRTIEALPLYFQTCDKRILTISSPCVKKLKSFRQIRPKAAEAGGVLLGRLSAISGDYSVDYVSSPQRSDRRARYSFYRSSAHNEIAVSYWKSSSGYGLYFGLWHTHPESSPVPSVTDIDDWERSLRVSKYTGNSLFFLIVGKDDVGCWQGSMSSDGVPLIEKLNSIIEGR
jgi:integrative and conjugative element protein (TIGR02256 family)